jgi:hypothetical protein
MEREQLFAERRANGQVDKDEHESLRTESTRVYDREYDGRGAPNAKVLAITAIGEAAFTDSSIDAAIGACTTASEAVAKAAAEPSPDDQYDATYLGASEKEAAIQAQLLRQMMGADIPPEAFK